MFVFEMLATIVTLLEGMNFTGLRVYPSGLIQNSAGRSSDRLHDGNVRPGDFAWPKRQIDTCSHDLGRRWAGEREQEQMNEWPMACCCWKSPQPSWHRTEGCQSFVAALGWQDGEATGCGSLKAKETSWDMERHSIGRLQSDVWGMFLFLVVHVCKHVPCVNWLIHLLSAQPVSGITGGVGDTAAEK